MPSPTETGSTPSSAASVTPRMAVLPGFTRQSSKDRSSPSAGRTPRPASIRRRSRSSRVTGTGTPVGDVIELTSHSAVFDSAGAPRESIAVGSIKSNIGHLKAVAGFAGLLKAVLALEHKTLPCSINVSRPPLLQGGRPLASTSLFINTRTRPWFPRHGLPRRAGVSSFGFGGANYHCVVEEFEQEHSAPYRVNQRPSPVLIASKLPEDLIGLMKSESAALEANPSSFCDFCRRFSLNGAVDPTSARVGFVAMSAESTVSTLRAVSAAISSAPGVPFLSLPPAADGAMSACFYRSQALPSIGAAALFVGQGAAFLNMFDEVAMNWPPFRRAISLMDSTQESAGVETPVSSVVYPRAPYDDEPRADQSVLAATQNSQPATVAVSLGVFDIFAAAGFVPQFTAGHSLGELPALSIGGAFDRKTLCEIVVRRAKAMSEAPRGAMAAVVGGGASDIRCEIPGVLVANRNSPDQVVIAGTIEAVATESARLTQAGFRVIPLSVESAFHTPAMEPAAASFGATISGLRIVTPSLPVFSNTSGCVHGQGEGENVAQRLVDHVKSPVRFQEEILAMHAAGARLFVEFGPGQSLTKMVTSTLTGKPDVLAVAVNPSKSRCPDLQLREAAVAIAVAGVPLRDFDPWNLPRCAPQSSKPPGATLLLSAPTFVSKATLEARKKVLEDGYRVTYTNGARTQVPKELAVWGPVENPSLIPMTWHPLAGVNGNPTPTIWRTSYPPRQVAFLPFPGNPNDANHTPGKFPLTWYHIWEAGCGRITQCLGSGWEKWDNLISSRMPAFDLQFLTRVLSANSKESAGKVFVLGEFDCPADAWFYQGSQDTLIPYSAIMEISLQITGIIAPDMKPLKCAPGDRLLYRNLGAKAELLHDVDCRGKTIKIDCVSTGCSQLGRITIYQFKSELSIEGSPFYRVEASFGFFDESSFEHQQGLDDGALFTLWLNGTSAKTGKAPVRLQLPEDEPRLFSSAVRSGLRRTSEQLQFLDSATIVEGGGTHNLGYAYGHKRVNPRAWFFSCHFWGDPVMPGSFGVESMFQLAEMLLVQSGAPEVVSEGTAKLFWQHGLGTTVWKYRGQLVPKSGVMEVEIHVKKLETVPGSHALVILDGSVLVDKLRT